MSFQSRLYNFAKQHNVLDDPRVRRLILRADTENTRVQRELWSSVRKVAFQHHGYPFTESTPNVSLTDNAVLLGKTLKQGIPFALREEDLVDHVLVNGRTGAGKTTLFRNVMTQLTVPFWAFDRKQDYRHMIQELPNLLVLPWSRLKFNPLKPPENVDPSRWAQVFTEIFSHATALLSGSKNYLLSSVMELYTEYGLFREQSEPYPSLFELFQLMEGEKINFVRKTANYRDTVANRLQPMLTVTGHIFDCSKGYPIENLMQRKVVFEFGGLNRDIQRFLQEVLFAYAYEHQLAKNSRDGELKLVIFVDEGKQMFSVYLERQDAAGIPEIDDLTARARQFGLGLLVADQEATKLTESIKANTKTKVLLPMGDHRQFSTVAETMDLNQRQREFTQTLGVGEAIVQVGNREPVPTSLHHHELEQNLSVKEVHESQEDKWDDLGSSPRREPEFLGEENGEVDHGEVAESSQETPEIELSEEAETLIRDVAENPFKKITDRYELFSSYHKGNETKNELTDKGLVEEVQVAKGDSRIKLLDTTEKGERYLDENGLELDTKGRGGITHQYWQHQIKEHLQGDEWAAEIEVMDADIYANNGQREVAIEVAMTSDDREVQHISDRIESGFDEVVVACRTKQIQSRLKQKLADSGVDGSSTVFRVLPELLDQESLI